MSTISTYHAYVSFTFFEHTSIFIIFVLASLPVNSTIFLISEFVSIVWFFSWLWAIFSCLMYSTFYWKLDIVNYTHCWVLDFVFKGCWTLSSPAVGTCIQFDSFEAYFWVLSGQICSSLCSSANLAPLLRHGFFEVYWMPCVLSEVSLSFHSGCNVLQPQCNL